MATLQALPRSPHFCLHELATGVYAAIHRPGGGAICNAGIVDLGDRTLVFDTFLAPQPAQDLRLAAEMLTGRPGIGGFLWQEYNAGISEHIILSILVIGVVGFLLDRLMNVVEQNIHQVLKLPSLLGRALESLRRPVLERSVANAVS